MLDSSLQPANFAEESQLLAGYEYKRECSVGSRESLPRTMSVNCCCCRLWSPFELDRFRELRPDGYIQCGIGSRTYRCICLRK